MILDKMNPAFQKAEGGLFSEVEKADVGDAAERMKEQGVAFLSWADPYYPAADMPAVVKDAMLEAFEDGAEHYTMPIGNPELKAEIARRLQRYNGLTVDPQRNILVTSGSDAALFYAMLPFVRPGDEVMIVDPSYPNNFQNTEILGGTVVRVPVYAENGYRFTGADFESRVTERTKMVVLTNPNNPTTVSYRRKEMEELADVCIRHDLILVVDQAFEEPVFDGIGMVTAAALPGMWERTVTVCSQSKGMRMSGFRIGYIIANDVLMDKLYGCAVTVLGTAGTAAQYGAIAVLRHPEYQQPFFETCERRRALAYRYLNGIPGVKMRMPESGFLSWVDVSALGTDTEVAAYLIEHAKAAVNAGGSYGEQGRGHLRIVHGALGTEEELEAVLRRIRAALIELAREKGVG